MLPKPLLYGLVILIAAVWAVAVIADIFSESFDAQGVHLIFGATVGGLIGLSKRDSGGGGGDK